MHFWWGRRGKGEVCVAIIARDWARVAEAVLRSRDISFFPVLNAGQFLARARAEAPGDPGCLCVYMCVGE